MTTLHRLLTEALGLRDLTGIPDARVTGVAQDHRKVEPGAVFVARRGAVADGHRFVRLAIDRGAVAVVGERAGVGVLPWSGTPYIRVPDDKAALAALAAAFAGHPSRRLHVIGVTGTDGKTTTSYLLHHLLQGAHETGLISTAAIRAGTRELPQEGHFTTPEAPEVQGALAAIAAAGCTHAVLESSSHGLAMRRLDAIEYRQAVWTNLSPEHLDYHGTLEEYREAKLSLVRRSPRAVVNRDDPSYPEFAAAAAEAVTYGAHEESAWRGAGLTAAAGELRFRVHHGGRSYAARLPLTGSYNMHNALAALAAAAGCGLEPGELVERLASFPGVPGRMQLVQREPFAVVVDFAHTAPALANALAALRPGVEGRLILVVGAAGERDPGKREPLGRAAAQGADLILFTEEDSRSEPPDEILAALERGAAAGGAGADRVRLVPDRRDAIREAIAAARPGDLVLLAGKGHERTLERAGEVLPWDEVAEARRHLG